MEPLVNHALAMCIFMGSNIALGTGIAIIDKTVQFSWSTFYHGLLKAGLIALAICGIYYAGTFVPDMIVISLGGTSVTTSQALLIVFNAAILAYAYKAFSNLITLLKLDTKVEQIDQAQIAGTPAADQSSNGLVG